MHPPVDPPPRGHHKVFLGMAAGVGKTYRMLQEGQAEAEAGRDVVIGYLEPHRRPATAAQADGLPVVPRRRVTHRETVLEELDLPAILERAPELCLIDELAHTNAPGVEHAKRFEDVQRVLERGIDVFSTVNVQHLESLNDQVAELTGVHVRETLPDAVLTAADEVVIVDLTPQALIERLRAGKVYPIERVPAALEHFFRAENLAALREVALRQVAEGVGAHRRPRGTPSACEDRIATTDAPQAVGERLLALITPEPHSQRIVRRAWRSAQRLGGELDLLWVPSRDGRAGPEERRQIEALRRLASVLGAHLVIESDDDIVAAVARVARERGTTYILMGAPRPRGALRRIARPGLVDRLLRALPGVDVRIVADRAHRPKEPS